MLQKRLHESTLKILCQIKKFYGKKSVFLKTLVGIYSQKRNHNTNLAFIIICNGLRVSSQWYTIKDIKEEEKTI